MRFHVFAFVLITSTRSIACWAADAQTVDFQRDIRPLLSDRCFKCHGPDATTREAGLRLDLPDAAIAELESGERAIVPGDVAASELVRRIRASDDDQRMPPADSGKTLSAAEIAKLESWIAAGGKYEKHWSFVAPTSPKVPTVKNQAWAKNDLDFFVLARIEQAGEKPAPEATREALIRRVAFDITGLPPTLAEIDAYLADDKPHAYERMVDRYLQSPAYGEQMARTWLDMARYADSNGFQYDTEREQWVWRDWVIDAFNRNLSFDQFTIEQLAGDLLPDATPQQRLATGFNRNHGVTIEGGVIDEEYRTEYVMDRLSTTGTAWLGLTIGCARCHDHKFDPISQKEFYQLFAFFNQVNERGLNGFDPKEQIASPLAAVQQREIDEEIARLRDELQRPDEVQAELVNAWAARLADSTGSGWQVLVPEEMKSSGGSTLTKLDDNSVLAGKANPAHDIYEISANTDGQKLTAVRLEALTHESLPGGGPGRHVNSNFVLSELEVTAVSLKNASQKQVVKFNRAIADYEQANYEVAKVIDGTVANSNGWAVDGPTRKEPATAILFAAEPFGFAGGTRLQFRLRHEANFGTHGVGRPRLSVTAGPAAEISLTGPPSEILQIAKQPADKRSEKDQQQLATYYSELHGTSQKSIAACIAALEKQKATAYPATMIMRDLPKPRATHVLNRGLYNEPKEQVSPNVPVAFPPLADGVKADRLALARWIVDPANPLTARVAVNRYWQRLFGVGLVKTSEDFGMQGELPSHPELLDWLATDFIASGWDIRHVQRLIVTSATYRQSSHVGRAAYLRDPENRLLARGPRLRLEAEEIRDGALAASGLLVQRLGGKSVYPYQPAGLWTELNNRPGYSQEYPQGHGDDLYRRSLYTFWKRTVPLPLLKTFDAPDREVCAANRSRTNTPLQSLVMLNSPQFVEAARHLGERMMTSDTADDKRIVAGFRLVVGRRPSDVEIAIFREHLAAERERFKNDEAAAQKLMRVGESPRDESLNLADHAAWTSVARLLMNLDEFITKD